MTAWRPVFSWLLISAALAACAGGGGSGNTAGSSGGTSSGGTGVAGSAAGASAGGTGGATAGNGGPGSAGASAGGTGGATAGNGGATGGAGPGTGGGGGTTTTGPCDFAGKIMCDDFEADPLGMKPTGGPWATSQCFATGFTLQVDGTQHKSGARSLVSQGVPYGDCMLHADLGTVSDFWVRAQVRWAAGAANQFTAHEVSAFELTPTMSTDDPGIRVGFRGDNSCQPTGVEVNITGGQEQTGCTGFQPQADTWTCFELHVVRDTADNSTTADLFIDGADQSYHVHGTAADTVVNPNPAVWRYLRLGTRSYSNAYPSNVYVDDIAVGTQRIGCN